MCTNTPFGNSWFGTQSHAKPDRNTLGPAKTHTPNPLSKPDGKLTFDKLSSVFLSNTNHEEDQPVHLKLRDPSIPIAVNLPLYAEPAQRSCPAAGSAVVTADHAQRRLQINAQNSGHRQARHNQNKAQ